MLRSWQRMDRRSRADLLQIPGDDLVAFRNTADDANKVAIRRSEPIIASIGLQRSL
jgi:hypothetical protein